ncbi:hypothetical protein ACEWY4_017305 [Coilia grayii]|uniref:Ig-like domain-containing protein n=1 Tax=Coilia grayii TaxID=363190 RepID=A0ABD1JGG3_9TELE
MKTNNMRPSTLILFCLTVLSCVRCAEVTVTGYEGGTAVIDCPFQEDHKSKPKYLKKGLDSNSTKLIQSNGHDEWTHRGRVSLQDRKNRSIFTVTIHNLTPEDAGIYVCGVEGWFNDFTTLVNVTVVTTPTHTATSSPLSDLTAMENTALFKTNHTSATSGEPLYISGCVLAAVVGLGLLIVALAAVWGRARRKRASSSTNSGNSQQDCHVYSEIQYTPAHPPDTHSQRDPQSGSSIYTLVTSPAPDKRPTGLHTASHPTQSSPSTDGIYSLASNPMPTLRSGANSVANQESEAKISVYSLASNSTPALQSGANSVANLNQSKPGVYSYISPANENSECHECKVVTLHDEPIGCDSPPLSSCESTTPAVSSGQTSIEGQSPYSMIA